MQQALNTSESRFDSRVIVEANELKSHKRRKPRRTVVNLKKQKQMAENEKMLAWKLASRKLGYFRPTAFQQLPGKGTKEWQDIWAERTNLLNHYWQLACDATNHVALKWINSKDIDVLKKTAMHERTAEQERLNDALSTADFREARRIQRSLLCEMYKCQQESQNSRVSATWEQAKRDIGTMETLADLPKRGTKRFKALLLQDDWKKQYQRTKMRHQELLSSTSPLN